MKYFSNGTVFSSSFLEMIETCEQKQKREKFDRLCIEYMKIDSATACQLNNLWCGAMNGGDQNANVNAKNLLRQIIKNNEDEHVVDLALDLYVLFS